MSSNGSSETRTKILTAARAMFEEFGYNGAGLAEVAKRAGVSRQAIYLHFASKAELLTALHLHVYETDVVPTMARHLPADDSALAALDACIDADVEIADRVWRVHEALTTARRQHPEVDETIRPREQDRYAELIALTTRLGEADLLPATVGPADAADSLWALVNLGTYRALVRERGWSLERYARWVRTTIHRELGLGG
ncbi:helix-turn-helix domain-containing protein [Nocardia sp. NPDC050717]|uniref:TetR/AcrR family transcriptional regulator n=1 Tax=Nocardia sp. NPDC050717 TaxID=3157221 RepID=UPI0033F3D0E3